MPQDYGLEYLAVEVTQDAIDERRALIETPREDAFRWVPDEFAVLAFEFYIHLGSPTIEFVSRLKFEAGTRQFLVE
ncbi:hypothetical protein R3P38DRAFT_3226174 [Favolaschia claudopus]|uniref:Uncharacterized protein n=1 Tax=Favolaschia claudopus TaxID=2862362 RepID=A0AAV9ZTP5_9AGAR